MHYLFAISLICLVGLTLPSNSFAQTQESDIDSEYCYRDSNDELYPDLPSLEQTRQLIQCNTSPQLVDNLISITDSLDIIGMNCNPAVPASCSGQNIDYTNFKIKFKFKNPTSSQEGIWWINVATPENRDTDVPSAPTPQQLQGLSLSDFFASQNNGVVSVDNFTIRLQKVGSKACIRFNGQFPVVGDVAGIINATTHCVFIPPPVVDYSAPAWGNIVAPVCLDYSVGHSAYQIPIAGVVVECVETTMRNIFALRKDGNEVGYDVSTSGSRDAPLFALNDPNDFNDTFFSTVQKNLRGVVLAALVLYVTIFGLSVVMSQKIPSKGDFIMAIMKFALVLYFSLGTGIVDFVPRLIDMSKTMSLILMESSKNLPINYNYCDFSQTIYEPGYGTMELWDVVDCKLTKYLGFREGGRGKPNEPIDGYIGDDTPKLLVISLLIWGGYGWGFIVVIFGLACCVFLITLVIRITHVYIIAMMAIYFLAFLAPLIIPTALFDYTKDLFNNWLKQLISFALQPVILFAFLAILFAISDFVMFRGNSDFCIENDSIRMVHQDMGLDRECTDSPGSSLSDISADEFKANWKCPDDSAPACILFKHTTIVGFGIEGAQIPTWVPYGENTSGEDVLNAFMLLFFIFFVLNAMIPTIEELSHRLTDSSGGGAVANASGTQGLTQNPAKTGTKVLAKGGQVGGAALGKGVGAVSSRMGGGG